MGLVKSGFAKSSKPRRAELSKPGVPESMVFKLYSYKVLAPSVCHVVKTFVAFNEDFRMATMIGLNLSCGI